MHEKILEELYKPFELKARQGVGGKTFKYVPSEDIVDRMNKVFKGDWSTEVVEKEVIEDQILVRVRVYAKDPNTADSKMYWQEGYASQPLAKFTQGPKTGQIIDVGNSFKSAMSKAIKTAVAKWGVGLYLEKGSVNESSSAGSWGPPTIPGAVPEIKPVEQPKIEQPPISVPVAEPVKNNVPSDAPPFPFDAPTAGPPVSTPPAPPVQEPVASPVFTDDNVVVTQPDPTASFNPPVDSVSTSNTVENLTDVQKAAIENILSVHGKSFAELAAAALQRTDNLPASPEDLSYQDAVKLIQYGNNLNTSS